MTSLSPCCSQLIKYSAGNIFSSLENCFDDFCVSRAAKAKKLKRVRVFSRFNNKAERI